jgi:hypothetical protein
MESPAAIVVDVTNEPVMLKFMVAWIHLSGPSTFENEGVRPVVVVPADVVLYQYPNSPSRLMLKIAG